MYTPSFINIDPGIESYNEGDTHTGSKVIS
jgi:hypothetical protein